MLGGTQARVAGQPVKGVHVAADAPPVRTDPNSACRTGHAYVQWAKLARPAGMPVLFLKGGTATGVMWETTPDGRPGWRDIMLREGRDVWLADAPGKGRASYQPSPAVLPSEPVFRLNGCTWMLLRVDPRYGPGPAKRRAVPGTQFPVGAVGAFMEGAVPRFAGQDKVELASYAALLAQACPCVIVAQSSGAYFAIRLAAQRPDLVRGMAAVALTATLDLAKIDGAALARVPRPLIWGDNLQSTAYRRSARATTGAYAAALRGRGGRARPGQAGQHAPAYDGPQQRNGRRPRGRVVAGGIGCVGTALA